MSKFRFAVVLFILSTQFTLPSAGVSCELYLADSTIAGAGLGIFSAVTKEKGDPVGSGDVCLPLFDIFWHNDNDFFFPMNDYVWDGRVMGMGLEAEDDDINAYWPGMDCAVNCNLALLNVAKASPVYDEGGLHRARHPGAGAISPYHNGTTLVTRYIPAGGELFKFYGDDWYVSSDRKCGQFISYSYSPLLSISGSQLDLRCLEIFLYGTTMKMRCVC
jgi:hypothetical protein